MPVLEQARAAVGRKGRPSELLASAFMAMLSQHLHDRTGRRHYGVVGGVTRALFPGAFASTPRRPAGSVREAGDDDYSGVALEARARDRIRRSAFDAKALCAALRPRASATP